MQFAEMPKILASSSVWSNENVTSAVITPNYFTAHWQTIGASASTTNATVHWYVQDTGTAGGSISTPYRICTNTATAWTGTFEVTINSDWHNVTLDKAALLRDAIRKNLSPYIWRRRTSLVPKMDPREEIARNSLRDMLSEADWRRYLTNGFVMIRGRSGYWYQLFGRQHGVNVYSKGIRIASICIHTDGSCPPTDHVLGMKLTIELDEQEIWRGGNVTQLQGGVCHGMALQDGARQASAPRPLIEVAQLFKRAA